MTYQEVFEAVKAKFGDADVSSITDHLVYQFNIEGEGEGIFYAEVKDGQLTIEPYDYYDRDVIFICSAETLLKIMDGKLDPAWAFTTQKLKLEGDIGKALRLKDMLNSKK